MCAPEDETGQRLVLLQLILRRRFVFARTLRLDYGFADGGGELRNGNDAVCLCRPGRGGVSDVWAGRAESFSFSAHGRSRIPPVRRVRPDVCLAAVDATQACRNLRERRFL